MVQEAVEEADGGGVFGEEPAPLVEGPVAGDPERHPLVGGGDEPEEELGTGVVERGEADLVDDDEVGPEQLFDHLADRVVGETPVEGLDELGGTEVAHTPPCVDRGVAERDEEMALARAGGPRKQTFSFAAIHSSEAR